MPGGRKGPSRYVLSCRIYGHGLDTHHPSCGCGWCWNAISLKIICDHFLAVITFHGLSLKEHVLTRTDRLVTTSVFLLVVGDCFPPLKGWKDSWWTRLGPSDSQHPTPLVSRSTRQPEVQIEKTKENFRLLYNTKGWVLVCLQICWCLVYRSISNFHRWQWM